MVSCINVLQLHGGRRGTWRKLESLVISSSSRSVFSASWLSPPHTGTDTCAGRLNIRSACTLSLAVVALPRAAVSSDVCSWSKNAGCSYSAHTSRPRSCPQ